MTVDCKSIERSELVRFQPTPMYFFKKIVKNFRNLNSRIWNAMKFLFPRFVGLVVVYFLRKTNTFIKSKYSKNRQWSKSIVYFGLWFGVISVFAITYYSYRFLFNFSYLWWAVVSLIGVTTLVNFKKYNFTNKVSVINLFI